LPRQSLLAFRFVYYFIPLGLAGAGLLIYEIKQHQVLVQENAQIALGFLSKSVSPVLSILLILSGGLMLVSGATTMDHGMLKLINKALPLSVVEVSHLAGSLIGLMLLFIARAVRLRINAAYFGILLLLSVGCGVSLLKGFNWQESLILAGGVIVFLPSRRFFYRKSSLLNMPFSFQWIAFLSIFLISAVRIGFFSYKHVEYSNDLWWQFAYDGDAPRFLRSTVVILVMVLSFSIYRLFRVLPVQNELPEQKEIDELEVLVQSSSDSEFSCPNRRQKDFMG